ncbi:hypothetical protein D3C83_32080 [compost metagenome]
MTTMPVSSTSGYISFSNWNAQPPLSRFGAFTDQSPRTKTCLSNSQATAASIAG